MNAINVNITSGDTKALLGKASTSRQMQDKSKRHPLKGVVPSRFKIHIYNGKTHSHYPDYPETQLYQRTNN